MYIYIRYIYDIHIHKHISLTYRLKKLEGLRVRPTFWIRLNKKKKTHHYKVKTI